MPAAQSHLITRPENRRGIVIVRVPSSHDPPRLARGSYLDPPVAYTPPGGVRQPCVFARQGHTRTAVRCLGRSRHLRVPDPGLLPAAAGAPLHLLPARAPTDEWHSLGLRPASSRGSRLSSLEGAVPAIGVNHVSGTPSGSPSWRARRPSQAGTGRQRSLDIPRGECSRFVRRSDSAPLTVPPAAGVVSGARSSSGSNRCPPAIAS